MTSSAERIRRYDGPAILSYGFRPFFLFGAIWAAIAVVVWMFVLSGAVTLPSHLAPVSWHVHELLYGYVPAVVAGFLLTAVPNWTGGLPVTGAPLAGLFSLWVAGRLAIFFSAWLEPAVAITIDLSFLAVFAAVVAREIIAGKNYRNLKVLVVVALLFAGNLVFHLEALEGDAEYGSRLGIAATVFLIILIGGRIIPSFTRNWLVRRGPGRLPVPFHRLDIGVMAVSGAALICWVAAPDLEVTGALLIIAGLANIIRIARWAGDRTFAEPLVLVLHVAYLFVPAGFLFTACAIFAPETVPTTAGIHAWTAGAMATMTLAVMTRASLGHTGRKMTANIATQSIYGAALVAAFCRILATFDGVPETALHMSAAAWIAAFAGFALAYGPILATRTATRAMAG